MFALYLIFLFPPPSHTHTHTELTSIIATENTNCHMILNEDLRSEDRAPRMSWFNGKLDKFPIAKDWDPGADLEPVEEA